MFLCIVMILVSIMLLLISLLIFGGLVLCDFSLILFVGIFVGIYFLIYIVVLFVVYFEEWWDKNCVVKLVMNS